MAVIREKYLPDCRIRKFRRDRGVDNVPGIHIVKLKYKRKIILQVF